MIPDHLRGKGFFSKKAGSFSKTPQRTVQAYTEREALAPDVSGTKDGTGDRRQYSVLNCIEIGIARHLSKVRVPFKQIKSAMKYLRGPVYDRLDKKYNPKDDRLEDMLKYDHGYMTIQIDPDRILTQPKYAFLAYSDDEGLSSEKIHYWFRITTAESTDQVSIVNINRIAREVLANME